eukprot:4242634-Amphidinium_carterae.1
MPVDRNTAWLHRRWRKTVDRPVPLPSTRGVYSKSGRAVSRSLLKPQVPGSSPAHRTDSTELR